MPTRPRSHELETESQRAFEALMPSGFVVRPLSDDYGIDREVEVFENGETTGLTFKVQLKATDGSGKSVRVRRTSLEYWMSLDVPVLIVTYEAKTGVMRSTWAHAVGADAPDTGAEKITVHMRAGSEMNSSWSDSLADDLNVVRQLRRGVVPLPLPVRIDSVVASSLPVLESDVLRASRRANWPMRRADAEEAAVELEVWPDRIVAKLPLTLSSGTLHLAGGGPADLESAALAEALLLLTASALESFNATAACELAKAVGPQSLLWSDTEIGLRLGPALVAAGEQQFVFEIMHNLASTGDPVDAAAADHYQVLLLSDMGAIEETPFREFSARQRETAEGEKEGNPREAGRLLYNLGHVHKARRDYATALVLFREAAELEPRYATDPDALRHLGSTLWEAGEYEESAEKYRAALGAGYSAQELRPLLADSLMFAGRYREALDELTPWSPVGEERDRVGLIRFAVLENLLAVAGIDSQDRAKTAPDARFDKAKAIVEAGDDVGGGISELLRTTDALDPAIWAALLDSDDQPGSFLPALTMATVLANHVVTWALALVFGLAAEADPALIAAVCGQARLHCGDAFYDAVTQLAAQQDDPEKRDMLRNVLAAAYSRDPVAHGNTVRLVDTSGTGDWVLDEFWVGPPGAVPPASPMQT